MNAENIFALIGICIPVVGALAGVAYSLLRGTLADFEQRLRRVEAATAECVRRADLDELRKEFKADFERLSQQLTDLIAERPRTARARR